MNEQKISPWTFLKQRVETEPHKAKLKGKLQLPKIMRKRESLSKQQNQSSSIIFKSKKGANRNVKTMILLQRLQDISSSTKVPLKKKTEPILSNYSQLPEEMLMKLGHLNYLNEMMLAAKFIRKSLEQGSNKAKQIKNYESSKAIIQQIRKKVLSIPQIVSCSQPDNSRIHDKNIQVKMSALRSILKREYEGSHQLKTKIFPDKKSSIVSCFKLKIAQNSCKAQ